jgi:Recombination, repair and ssDNA binding protein UvsY
MKIESIFEEWEKDSQIDKTDLDEESLKIPKLHHKYYRQFVSERLLYRKLEADLKQLKLEKHEFYTQGPTKETQEKGWQLPPKGMILKNDLPMYIDADKDIIELSLKIGYQLEKIDLLESILKTLQNRGYNIKTAVDWIKFTQGN